MDDNTIIDLYLSRDENAIAESSAKYGKYCFSVAKRILSSNEDCEECVNDTFLGAWNSIPPAKPSNLKCFLASITRHICLDRYDYNSADKRNAHFTEALDEAVDIPSYNRDDEDCHLHFKEVFNSFLSSLDKNSRIAFLQRYYYFCSVKEIAQNLSMTESAVKVSLHRTRNKLKKTLEKENIKV